MQSMMPKGVDRLLVLAAAALVVAISWDALRAAPHRHAAPPVTAVAVPQAAPVPERIRLVPSSTAFLPTCPARDLRLSVGSGPWLTLRFTGSRCHLPPLHLRAVLRAGGRVVYRGPALAHEELSGNYAVTGMARGRLLGCRRALVQAEVRGAGLSAAGSVRCALSARTERP
jgi:hypothetical protein